MCKFLDHKKDLERERLRYDHASSMDLVKGQELDLEGYLHFPSHHSAPFKEYYSLIVNELANVKNVLEIGAGAGQHTRPAVAPNVEVIALDISLVSLEKLERRFHGKVKTVVGNIEELPFHDESFDLIISCGVLSYGDPSKVDNEILRTLRPGGSFIFIDSLNHNPIYKVNRWIRYLRGSRTLSTVLRIPKIGRVEKMANNFEESHFLYFGKHIWVYQLLKFFLGSSSALEMYNMLEKREKKDKYAFKIVCALRRKKASFNLLSSK